MDPLQTAIICLCSVGLETVEWHCVLPNTQGGQNIYREKVELMNSTVLPNTQGGQNIYREKVELMNSTVLPNTQGSANINREKVGFTPVQCPPMFKWAPISTEKRLD